MKKNKILWVVPKNPFPADDGAKKAIESIVKSLGRISELHLVILKRKDDSPLQNGLISELKEKWGIKSIEVINTNASAELMNRIQHGVQSYLTNKLPFTYIAYAKSNVVKQFREIYLKINPDYTVADTLHASVTCLEADIPFYYRSHNIEYQIWERMIDNAENLVLSQVLKSQSKKVRSIEQKVVYASKKVFFISRGDRNYFLNDYKVDKNKLLVLPVGMEIEPLEMPNRKNIKILYLGKLDWRPNQHGLTWFLDNVWSKISVENNHLFLDIVGSGDSSWLDKYKNLKKLKVHGRVEHVRESYENCHFIISPVFYGSGVRIKIIEAASFGRVCVSTMMGIEGSGFSENEYFNCETERDWLDMLRKISIEDIEVRRERLIEYMNSQFNPHGLAKKFLNQLTN